MRTRALVLLTLLTLLGLPTWGRSAVNHAPIRATSLWVGSSDTAIQTTAQTRYALPMAPEIGDYSATEAGREGVCPIAATIDQLVVSLGIDIGDAGDNLTVTLRKNGAGTSFTCTITGAAGTEVTCSDTSNVASCVAGDRLSLEFVTVGTPAAATAKWAMRVRTARANRAIWLANQVTSSTSADRFYAAQGAFSVGSSSDGGRVALPVAGALVGLAVHSDTTYTSTQTRTITAMVDGSADTAVECVLDATGATACLDASGPIALARGTTLSLRNTPANTPPADALGVGLAFAPARSGTFVVLAGSSSGPATTGSQYIQIAKGNGGWASSEFLTACIVHSLTITSFYASVATAPGAGADWNFFARRQDTATDTAATVVISGASEVADVWDGSINVPDLASLNFKIVPSVGTVPAAPGATRISMSATMSR